MSNQLHEQKKEFMHKIYGQPAQVSSRLFYDGRIRFILEQHHFTQREQMLGMLLNAAMGDRGLTVSDLLYVISQVEEAHKKSMEINFNEEWGKDNV